MLIALTDWMASITSGLTEQQMQDMLRSEHGGLNEIFADVASITGNKKYLELARRFSHKTLLEPLISGEDHLTGMHANTQIPVSLSLTKYDLKSWHNMYLTFNFGYAIFAPSGHFY